MGTESTHILTGRCTSVTGEKTNSTVVERKFGQMGLNMMATTTWEESKDKEYSNGQMDPNTKGTSMKTALTAKGATNGKTAGSTQEDGKITRWKDAVSSLGQMEENTKAIT